MKPLAPLLTLALAAHLALIPSASASSPLVTESFDGPPDHAPLTALSERPGWASLWKADPALTQDPADAILVQPGLSSPALTNHGFPTKTGTLQLDLGKKNILYRRLETPINWSTEGTYYLAYLCRWTGNHESDAARVRLMLGETTPTGDFYPSLRITLSSTGVRDRMSLRINSSKVESIGRRVLPAGDTYLIAVRILTSADNLPDLISAIAYPPGIPIPANEPTDWPTDWETHIERVIGGQNDVIALEAQGFISNRLLHFDELRIGSSWQQVMLGQ